MTELDKRDFIKMQEEIKELKAKVKALQRREDNIKSIGLAIGACILGDVEIPEEHLQAATDYLKKAKNERNLHA